MRVLRILENKVSGVCFNSLRYMGIEKQELRMQANSNWFS